MQKKILIVGNNASWAIETHYNKYLNELGYSSSIFNVPSYVNLTSFTQKVRYRLGDSSIYNLVNKILLQYCDINKPDIIWVFKGAEISVKTLEILGKRGHFLVNYNPDHPFIRTSITHGGRNIPNSISKYNLHFSYRRDLVKQIATDFNINTVHLPFGFEISEKNFDTAKSEEEINRVCFVGTPDIDRATQLNEIANNGFKVDIYSLTYQGKRMLDKNKNIRTLPVVLNQEFWNTLRKYRVQINFLRQHNIGSHNQRTFEVPGIGGILLTPFSEEQQLYFENKVHFFTYQSFNETYDIIDNLLSLNIKEADKIREAARLHSIKNEYSYKNRAEIVKQTLNQIL